MMRSTHSPTRGLALACVASLALTACGSDDDGGVAVGNPTGRVAEGEKYTVTGFVGESGGGAPVAGARVCLVDHDEVPCAEANAGGKYALRLPESWTKSRELALHVTAPGHVPYAGMIRESPTFDRDGARKDGYWPFIVYMLSADAASALNLDKQSAERALVELAVTYKDSGAPEGAEVTLTSSAERAARSQRVPKSGEVLFADLPPGRFELGLSGCTPKADLAAAWRARGRGAIAGIAVKGTVTRLALTCQEARPTAKPQR